VDTAAQQLKLKRQFKGGSLGFCASLEVPQGAACMGSFVIYIIAAESPVQERFITYHLLKVVSAPRGLGVEGSVGKPVVA
jgi:hypothetical protein